MISLGPAGSIVAVPYGFLPAPNVGAAAVIGKEINRAVTIYF